MVKRLHTLTGALMIGAVLLFSSFSVMAQKKGFNGIVEHIEKNYQGRRTRIPMLGFANFVVKLIRPAGVKSFKLAVFEGHKASQGNAFAPAMRSIMPKEWQPLLNVSSHRGSGERTFIYAKPAGKDLQLMTVVFDEREAVVIEVKLNPDAVSRFMNDPKIMGISLAGNLRGKSSGGPWMGGGSILAGGSIPRGRIDISRGASDIGRRVDVRDEGGYTLTGPQAAAPPPSTVALTEASRPALKPEGTLESESAAKGEGEEPAPAATATVVAPPDAVAAELRSKDAIRIDTQLVNLNIKAVDKTSQPLANLTREDFVVYEDGIKQEISYFDPVTAPINLVLLLDLSGSTSDRRGVMLSAAKKFVDSLSPKDRVAVTAFTREYYVVSDFTTDRNYIKSRLDTLKKVSGGTNFYDAMWTTLDLLAKVKDTRKAVVVLTDGVDEKLLSEESGSSRPFDVVLDRAAEEDVSIYPVYLDSELADIIKQLANPEIKERVEKRLRERRLRPREIALKQLDLLAESTAGCVFKAENEHDLDGVYQRVAAELQMLYSVAYSPENGARDGKFRKINVEVKRDGVALRARRGYIAK